LISPGAFFGAIPNKAKGNRTPQFPSLGSKRAAAQQPKRKKISVAHTLQVRQQRNDGWPKKTGYPNNEKKTIKGLVHMDGDERECARPKYQKHLKTG